MRLVNRLAAAIVALVLAVTMSSALLSPAEAVPAPKHDLKVKAKELGTSNKFVLFGKVPTAAGKKIKVLRNAGGGKFSVYKTVKVKSDGKFRTRIFQVGRKQTCFKVEVPKVGDYKKTTKRVACIVTT